MIALSWTANDTTAGAVKFLYPDIVNPIPMISHFFTRKLSADTVTPLSVQNHPFQPYPSEYNQNAA